MFEIKFDAMFKGTIDLQGIENFTALEWLRLDMCNPVNIEGIGGLPNLNTLSINLMSPEPSLEFLRGASNLLSLYIEPTHERYGVEPFQILDVSPLATLKKLERLSCTYFIIKNVSALDALPLEGEVDFAGGRLFDETEKSKHYLVFDVNKE
jgi:hypothetical protein